LQQENKVDPVVNSSSARKKTARKKIETYAKPTNDDSRDDLSSMQGSSAGNSKGSKNEWQNGQLTTKSQQTSIPKKKISGVGINGKLRGSFTNINKNLELPLKNLR